MNKTELSKIISHALRHEPWVYELEIDHNGWVPISELINSIKETSSKWSDLNIDTIREIIASSDKVRFEIDGDNIRALYGHSIPEKISYSPGTPPDLLFHGTTREMTETILQQGLKPMSRQYVHLSTDKLIAENVARRKGSEISIIEVDARKAYMSGVIFYQGNKYVWLCDELPAMFCHLNK